MKKQAKYNVRQIFSKIDSFHVKKMQQKIVQNFVKSNNFYKKYPF